MISHSLGNINMQDEQRSETDTVQRTNAADVLSVQVLGLKTTEVWEVQNQPESWPPLAVPKLLPGDPLARRRWHRKWSGVGRQDLQQDSCQGVC